ncbi:MAG: hypothetical protein Q8R32_01085 [bacterium]|nr:hypothetical protein [bacterium]
MNDILRMTKEKLLALTVETTPWPLTAEGVVHIATTLGAFWVYDYAAAEQGRVGAHALLKSGLHSDGFFDSRILLAPENIRRILSHQIVMRLWEAHIPTPDYVAGVPDGATALGSDIADILGVREAHMEKVDGRIVLKSKIPSGATVLLAEDFCTRGTGFVEAVRAIALKQPFAKILPVDPVIINRGGLKEILVEEVGTFTVLPIAEWRIQDWDPKDCPPCALGSTAIKPKASPENWGALVTSQLP